MKNEFFEGVSVRYEHIVEALDFPRHDKINAIAQAFEKSQTVIIHAASGQGKSALAYRYLHEHFAENCRFSIELIEGPRHALQIATALDGHASVLKVPIIIYVDIRPNDTSWPILVYRLSRNPYLKILVTIREEDFKRAALTIHELDYQDIDLEFNKEEAFLIYDRAKKSHAITDFLDFNEVWNKFGRKGPLLEFVFLLTKTKSLENRLKGQVQRIRREVREKKIIL